MSRLETLKLNFRNLTSNSETTEKIKPWLMKKLLRGLVYFLAAIYMVALFVWNLGTQQFGYRRLTSNSLQTEGPHNRSRTWLAYISSTAISHGSLFVNTNLESTVHSKLKSIRPNFHTIWTFYLRLEGIFLNGKTSETQLSMGQTRLDGSTDTRVESKVRVGNRSGWAGCGRFSIEI